MMAKSLKSILTIAVAVFGLSAFTVTPVLADTSNTSASDVVTNLHSCDNLEGVARETAGCNGSTDKLPNVIIGILNVVIGIAGLVAAVFIIIGGINFMTANGDPSKVKKAKDMVLYSCIGLVVCALAYAIVNWAISAVENGNNAANNAANSANVNNGP